MDIGLAYISFADRRSTGLPHANWGITVRALAWMPSDQAILAKRSSEDDGLTTPRLQEPPYDLERRDGL